MRKPLRSLALILCAVAAASCFVFRTTSVATMTPAEAVGTEVRSPLKAFHNDGTISVFPSGALVTEDFVVGVGTHYGLDLETSTTVSRVPLDSLAGIEAFRGGINPFATVLVSALASVGSVALIKAAFGSCPTVYTYEDGAEVLHAEAFSYSIAPLLETRDVDRLEAAPGADGLLRLEVRNEALETHYINHLEIIEARHAPDRRAYPNESGRVVTVGATTEPLAAHDRDGRVVTSVVRSRDGTAFASTEQRIRAVTGDDYLDHVELTFQRPPGETAALVLRLRNSLLNSLLFYDVMLGAHGAEALDWLGRDINRIGRAVELGEWFQETMGLRVSVLGPGGWKEVARVGDTGPIAWKDVAVSLPVPETAEVRVRLAFLTDEWRIDYVGLAADVERAEVEYLPVASVAPIGGAADPELRAKLAEPDEDYLVTTAGTAVSIDFGPAPDTSGGQERTFFLSSQGYYTEWVRPQWIRAGGGSEGFRPSRELVVDLMARWLVEKDDYERQFYQTRIPVR